MNRTSIFCIALCLLFSAGRADGQSCKPPFSFKFEEFTTTSVRLKWSDSNSGPSGWEIELVKKGSQPSGIPTHGPVAQREIVFGGLEPSTAYEVYIRTVCSPSSISSWNVAIPFTTVLEMPTNCQINLPLKDNGTETFLLEVPQTGILGEDIFIKGIDLIIEHDWPADLRVILVSPNGQQLVLSNHNGTAQDDFGIPGDTTCLGVTRFAPGACRQLKESTPPYLGTFRPDGDVEAWRPDTLNGNYWKLVFFDRALKDIGKLRYANIEFSTQKCLTPVNFVLTGADANELSVSWDVPAASCNTVRLGLTKPDGTIQEVFVECSEKQYTFFGLEPNTDYVLNITGICSDFSQSQESCSILATTTCEAVSISESFDNMTNCTEGCGTVCSVNSTTWYNDTNDDGSDWIVWAGPTDTDNTGPSADISGEGRYLYLENNPAICGSGGMVVLKSQCIDVRHNDSRCDMSFYYHMFGTDITTLRLEASTDEGNTWELVSVIDGNQGDKWHRKTVSLDKYDGLKTVFRFIATTSAGVLGDIAIDQIEFYGSTLSTAPNVYYPDNDGDGYGQSDFNISACRSTPPANYVANNADCDDSNQGIHPGALEIQCNAIDENCNGSADDRPETNPITYTKTFTHPSCNGSADGRILLNISGGNPPYNIKWNNLLTGNEILGLSPGVYAAEITDIGGCRIKTEFIELKAETVLSVLVDQRVQPTCSGKSDGSISIVHTAGSDPYQYNWSTGAKTKDLANIGEGRYSVTVTDGRNCSAIQKDIVLTSRPSVVTGVLSQKNPLCFGQLTGSVELISFGGSPPYQYSWENGNTSPKINLVGAGMYNCTITDTAGCKNFFTATIDTPNQLSAKVISTENVRCFGEKNGSVKTESSGGTPPYTFLWNNFNITEDIFNLKAGTYTLTLTDNNGCSTILPPVIISEPEEMLMSIDSIASSTCILGRNGFISVLAEGGNGDYQYSWGHSIESSSSQDSLLTGNYSVTSYDKLGCKASLPNIFVPYVNDDLGVSLSVLQENRCTDKPEGIIAAGISKGDPQYDFNWSQGEQYFTTSRTDTLTQLAGGVYQLTVTDRTGCTGVSNSVTIPVLPPFYYKVDTVILNRCNSDSNGVISVSITGGTKPWSVTWNNGMYSGTNIQGLANGMYSGLVQDSLGCTLMILPVTVSSESDIKINATVVPDTNLSASGKLCVFFTGGKPPYRYSLNALLRDELCTDNLPSGNYDVKVTDSYGCESMGTYVVENISDITHVEEDRFALYPNPADGQVFISGPEGIKKLEVFSVDGKLVLQKQVQNNSKHADIETSSLLPGIYLIRIITEKAWNPVVLIIK